MVHVSTACLKGSTGRFERDFYTVLKKYIKAGIDEIELGSCHNYIKDLKPLFAAQKKHNLKFIVHTFFPPLKEQMCVNIASQNAKVYKMSMGVAKKALEFCRKTDTPLYTIHPGYLADVKGKTTIKAVSKTGGYEEGFSILVDSLQIIVDRAKSMDVKIGVETQFNEDGFMLGSKPEEFARLFKAVKSKNLGILFDFGHTYGNMHLYKMKPKEYITPLLDKIIAFHIHKGFNRDAHAKVPNLEFFKDFPKGYFKKKFMTLEVNRLDIKGILQQRALLERLKA